MTSYVHEDWTLFRSLPTLAQKAGVPQDMLQRTVLKELVDNALDAGSGCKFGRLDRSGLAFFVDDNGPGIPADRMTDIFSVRRPLSTTKLQRTPTRGALGNGTRVVAGAMLASGGKLIVHSHGKAIELGFLNDGTTRITGETSSEKTIGTRIEVFFGKDFPVDKNPFAFASRTLRMEGNGPIYEGKASAWWEDSDSMYERCQAAGTRSVREEFAELEGCSGKKAGKLCGDFKGRLANSLTREECNSLLSAARALCPPVSSKRLKTAKESGVDFPSSGYASIRGHLRHKSHSTLAAKVPVSVEAWVMPAKTEDDQAYFCVNRSAIVTPIEIRRHSKREQVAIFGAGLKHLFNVGKRQVLIIVNVQTPYLPLTSDGKSPDLSTVLVDMQKSIEKAARANNRRNRQDKSWGNVTLKRVVLDHLSQGAAMCSGKGRYRFSQRQLFYRVRPFVLEILKKEPKYDAFCQILTDYEEQNGPIIDLYRDPRGIIYHPHLHEEIPLGTLSVEKYKRPAFTFNKVLYCEKEGFFPLLRAVDWPEQYDCALMTSKGMASRAARDLLDMLGETEEELTFFAIHDADAYGTLIYESLQQATRARSARKVKIVNLGLEPWEGLEMKLEVEEIEAKGRRKPVAKYIKERPGDWENWLQSKRIELNSMTTPQFVAWLSKKIEEHGHHKVTPSSDILKKHFDDAVLKGTSQEVRETILAKSGFSEKVNQELERLKPAIDFAHRQLPEAVKKQLEWYPKANWKSPVEREAEKIVQKVRDGEPQ